jgi:hypothetical protein
MKINWTEYDNLIIKLIDEGFSYERVGNRLNLHRERIRRRCIKLGIKSKYYNEEKRNCVECNEELTGDRRKKFCNHNCATNYNNVKRGYKFPKLNNECLICKKEIGRRSIFCSNTCYNRYNYFEYIKRWKNGEEDGFRGKEGLSTFIRIYLFEKYDNRCCECGWNKINKKTNKIPLQIEHIDGDYKNNKEENLKLLCPNCHSLTETYGSLNRGKGRKNRRESRKK